MIRDFWTSLLHYFVNITTATLLVTAIYLTISGHQMNSVILWEILLSGFITAVPSAFLVCLDAKNGRILLLLWLAHFLLIFFTTLILIERFGWYKITAFSILLTFMAVVVIYIFTCVTHYIVDKKHAEIMNQQLKKRYSKTNNDKN